MSHLTLSTASRWQLKAAFRDYQRGASNPLIPLLQEEATIAAAEQGADREPDYDAEQFEVKFFERYDTPGKEPPADLAYRVLHRFYEATESFDVGHVGTELAYLALAVLAPPSQQEIMGKVEWSCSTASRTHYVLSLFWELFAPEDPIWDYIEIMDQ